MMDLSLDRQWAAEVLTDTCSIWADSSSEPTWDETENKAVYGADELVWSGPCSASNTITERRITDGGDFKIEGDWIIRVPLEAEGVTSGMVVTLDSIHAGGDPSLAGLALTVRVIGRRSSAILRRLQCVLRETTSP